MKFFGAIGGLCAPLIGHAADFKIDGIPNEALWAQARVFADFVTVQPYTLEAPRLKQTAKLLSHPQGLLIAFEIEHPASEARTKPLTQRDQIEASDRVNLIIDFDGKGRTAYNFGLTLSGSIEDSILGRNTYRSDWDGDWQYAVHETEHGWTAEMLIPWTVAAMDPPENGLRHAKVYFDRVIQGSNERFAYPAVRWSQSNFIESFAPAPLQAYSASETTFYPYVSVLHDNLNNGHTTRAGLDVFYKNTAGVQVIGTLNPDFGQVESDDLVVNFSAVETFFSDKRPFFTENHELFTWGLPDGGQLLYTRRIGALRDDGRGGGDIDAAAKVTVNAGNWTGGYLAAIEEDHEKVGRQFQALRNRWHIGGVDAGMTVLSTERPFRDRQATVLGVDVDARPFDGSRLRAQALQSDIETGASDRQGRGYWLVADYTPNTKQQHTLDLINWDKTFDLNDLGYLSRNNLKVLGWESRLLWSGFDPASRWREMEGSVRYRDRATQDGRSLRDNFAARAKLRDTGNASTEFEMVMERAGVDDLISRGNGDWLVPTRVAYALTYYSARNGDHAWEASLTRGEEGLYEPYWNLRAKYSHWFGERFTASVNLRYRSTDDWVKWQTGTRFASFAREQTTADINLGWFPMENHELRAKIQWLGLTAHDGEAYALQRGRLQALNKPEPGFSVNNFGLQLRYRYRLGSLSDLFAVYSRGGFEQQDEREETSYQLLDDALRLRDADQFLVKLRLQY